MSDPRDIEVPEMVERIARAISYCSHRKLGSVDPTSLVEITWRQFIDDARLVIYAMRKPTETMMVAASENAGCIGDDGSLERGSSDEEYEAMIVASLWHLKAA
jgi:hypothetical protein